MRRHIDLQAILADIGPACAAHVQERDESDGFVEEAYDLLRDRKVFSALVPAELGGGGARHSEVCAFIRGLAHHCSSTALALSMHQHLVAAAAFNHAAGRPGKALLEKVAGGETVLVSTGANDWLESNGRAEAVDGGFLVTATKPFASGSPRGGIMVTSAVFDGPQGAEVLHFPVPLSAPGVTLMDDWRTLGMRATGSQTVRLERVFVPQAAVALRRPRGEYHGAFSIILTVAMPLIMSAYVGVAQAAAGIARRMAADKREDDATILLIGEMGNLLTTAELAHEDMVRLAGDLDFQPSPELAAKVLARKTICTRHVLATAEKALEVAGGAGFFRKAGLERLLRDAHGAQFHPLPEKRQQMFSGRLALGLPPIRTAGLPAQRAAA